MSRAGADAVHVKRIMSYARVCALAVVKSGKIKLVRFNSNRDICKEPNEPDGWTKAYGIASVTKSITSTLLGHAIAARYKAKTRAEFEAIVQKPIDEFVPELAKSGYAEIPLERVLGMRSGIRWREYGWHGLFADWSSSGSKSETTKS